MPGHALARPPGQSGMRALSILWVMLGHAIAELNVVGFSNPADAFPPMGMTHTLVR